MGNFDHNAQTSIAKTKGLLSTLLTRLDGRARDPHREAAERALYANVARDARMADRALAKLLKSLGEV